MKTDFRTAKGKALRQHEKELARRKLIHELISVAILGFFVGTILTKTIMDTRRTSPKPQGMTMVQEVNAEAPQPRAFCNDPMNCFRDVGEQMGMSNKDIMIAIRISKAECGMRPDALGKNTNGTFDIGVMQINDVHGKRISRADRLDYEQNIRFAYKLRFEQGNWNAWSVCKNGKVDCK